MLTNVKNAAAVIVAAGVIVSSALALAPAGGDYYVTAPNGERVRIETGPIAVPAGLDVTLCMDEGDNGCVWLGSESGNGVGLSYYASPAGVVHYVTEDRARGMLG
jgi:hypothetical protein